LPKTRVASGAEVFASKWVRRELEFADEKGLPVVSVCAGLIEPPDWFQFSFGGRQCVTFETGGARGGGDSRRTQFDRLRRAGRQFGAGDGSRTRAATLEDLMAAGLLPWFSKKIWHSHCSSAKLVLAQ
jgi:hypothetical protein